MFQKLECVCLYTADIAGSLAFYTNLGLVEAWRIERVSATGLASNLIGLKFPRTDSSELVLSNNAEVNFTEVEIHVDDVRATYAALSASR